MAPFEYEQILQLYQDLSDTFNPRSFPSFAVSAGIKIRPDHEKFNDMRDDLDKERKFMGRQ
jgi:hypothetical protein